MKLPAPLKAFACLAAAALLAVPGRAQDDVTPAELSSGALAKEEARAVAKDAFIYAKDEAPAGSWTAPKLTPLD